MVRNLKSTTVKCVERRGHDKTVAIPRRNHRIYKHNEISDQFDFETKTLTRTQTRLIATQTNRSTFLSIQFPSYDGLE